MKTKFVVGTRGSKLALVQAESVVKKLESLNPGFEFEINKIVTAGDRDRKTHLDRIGVDVFVKELEEALLDGRIDLAVHSLKDVPTDTPKDLGIIATLERDDAHDVLIAKAPLERLNNGSKIGTGSLRRTIQLAHLRPDLETVSIRGNVDTRLRKVESGEIDGIILAAAGLNRLGWKDKIMQLLPFESFLPAAGQGAIAIEARLDDKETTLLVSTINHFPTWQCVTAERTYLRELGGGCRAPIAALAKIDGKKLTLDGLVASPVRKIILRDSIVGDVDKAAELGTRLARTMLDKGASEFIAEAKLNEIR